MLPRAAAPTTEEPDIADTITIPRAEYERLVAKADLVDDIASIDAHRAAVADGTAPTLVRLATVLGVDVEDLLPAEP